MGWLFKWRNTGSATSPHWQAEHAGYKVTVWGYKRQWNWVVYKDGVKVAQSTTDKRNFKKTVITLGTNYDQGFNAKRGAERWLLGYLAERASDEEALATA